jgi:hypothetical protein
MRRTIILGVVLALGACAQGQPDLINFRASNEGPDEFSVLPTRPLVLEGLPATVASLPAPTPGGPNLTDPTPVADAYAALGGSMAAANRPADGGIVNYASRRGVNPGIRSELAADDGRYRQRRRGRLLERVFGVSTYYSAYEPQSMDQYRELERARRAGVRNPAAPPPDVEVPRRPIAAVGPSFYDPSPAISGG